MIAETTAIRARVNAIKAFGVIVSVSQEDFVSILRRQEAPLVVHAAGGFLSKKHRYLTSYKGLAFITIDKEEVHLPIGVEVVEAKKITLPDM